MADTLRGKLVDQGTKIAGVFDKPVINKPYDDTEVKAGIAKNAADIAENKSKISALEAKHNADIAAAKTELNGNIDAAKNELNTAINTAKTELNGEVSRLDTAIGNTNDAVTALETKHDAEIEVLEAKHDADQAQNVGSFAVIRDALALANRKVKALTDVLNGRELAFDTQEYNVNPVAVPSGAVADTLMKIGGKSVVWNQQIDKSALVNQSVGGVTVTANGDGTVTLNGTNTGSNFAYIKLNGNIKWIKGHKYYCRQHPSIESIYDGSGADGTNGIVTVNNDMYIGYKSIYLRIDAGASYDNLVVPIRAHDLTQMGLGDITTVDDPRIKIIEQYAEAHPEYNPGEIISSQIDAVAVSGKNLIDLSKCKSNIYVRDDNGNEYTLAGYNVLVTDFMPVESGVKYVFSGYYRQNNGNSGAMYDKDKNYVGSIHTDADANRIIPSGVAYVRLNLWGNYFNDITKAQFERSEIATDFAPYVEPKIIQTNLPELKSAGTVSDEVEYNVTFKNMKAVDLGSLGSWAYSSSGFWYLNAPTLEPLVKHSGTNTFVQVSTYPNAYMLFNNTQLRVYTSDNENAPSGTLHYEAVEGGEDYTTNILHERVGSVDLGTLAWVYSASSSTYFFTDDVDMKQVTDGNVTPNYTCHKYTAVKQNSTWVDGIISTVSARPRVIIMDVNYSKASDFKTAMLGVMLYYELANERIRELPDIPTIEAINVEAGGEIRFVNHDEAFNMQIPSTHEWVVRNSEV